MRVLVLGASGMLGHTACRVLSESREVHAALRKTDGLGSPGRSCFENCTLHDQIDALDDRQLTALILTIQPDVVLNCIGIVKQLTTLQNAENTIRLNALLPHVLARICSDSGAKLIQMSTDCVFSGKSGFYTEKDRPDPVDLYGQTKLLGEVSVAPHLTIRTSFIGRELNRKTGLLEWFLSQKENRTPGYTRAIFSGLTSLALCEVLEKILDRAFDTTGIYHVAGAPICKHELLSLISDELSLNRDIYPDDSIACDRSLDGRHFLQSTGITVPAYDLMIGQLAKDNQNYE